MAVLIQLMPKAGNSQARQDHPKHSRFRMQKGSIDQAMAVQGASAAALQVLHHHQHDERVQGAQPSSHL
jgi:hypothetical protein